MYYIVHLEIQKKIVIIKITPPIISFFLKTVSSRL